MMELRKFGPKKADHPSCGDPCRACGEPMKAGQYTTLVALGPGDDPEEQEMARTGRPYNAVAVEVHWTCATGEQEELDGNDVESSSRADNVPQGTAARRDAVPDP